MSYVLLISIFVIATCGLVYELIAGALASYLLGDSVTQFSTIIGCYLFAMGIGSWLSRYIHRNLLFVFVQVEILIGLVGGFSAAILFFSFEHVVSFRILLYSLVGLTGMMVGVEIPLLMRILKDRLEFKDLVAKVFTFDYVGALIASLLFPLVLVPHFGLVRSAFFFGILNVAVALWVLYKLGKDTMWSGFLRSFAVVSLIVLVFGFAYSDEILSFTEAAAYPDKVIYSKSSKYQRLVVTKSEHETRLYLNGNLQFSSRDEYRYHEALVHVGLAALSKPRKVLILGGGDGLAMREVLKYPSVESITLIDLDEAVTKLFSESEVFSKMNDNSFDSEKVRVINTDAFTWLRQTEEKFDFIAVDFPDPSNFSVGKLYSNKFYKELIERLNPEGLVAIQSTSPYVAKKSFWCVDATLESVGFKTWPYHVYVPSFGEWGFILAGKNRFEPAKSYPPGLKFVNASIVPAMFDFPEDMKVAERVVNKLNNQMLVRLFEEEWASYVQ